jgi:PBP1b-binding outer membrane lipoprotein LpoB
VAKEKTMKVYALLMLVLATMAITGCSEPTIDASSEAKMKESVAKVRESLPEAKRTDFDQAVQLTAFSQIDMKSLFANGGADAGDVEGKMRDALNGKTAEQVLAQAEQIQAERKAREKEQALAEIRELVAKRDKAEQAKQQLEQFQVVRSRFYMRERQYLGKQPIIELTVKNGTDLAISRAYFSGTIASPDRSVPWHEDQFNYSISGGLEPGEEATWTLAPNSYSDWGKVDAPADAVFTVLVEKLDGPDGEVLYSTRDFSERDRNRLAELKKQYGVD